MRRGGSFGCWRLRHRDDETIFLIDRQTLTAGGGQFCLNPTDASFFSIYGQYDIVRTSAVGCNGDNYRTVIAINDDQENHD